MTDDDKKEPARYVLTRREMKALRDFWLEKCVESRREGDDQRADANFRCAVDWDERSERP